MRKCAAPIGWDTEQNVDFFRLIGLIWHHFAAYRKNIEKFLSDTLLKKSLELLNQEFGALMSTERCELIKRCLHLRQQRLLEAVNQFR